MAATLKETLKSHPLKLWSPGRRLSVIYTEGEAVGGGIESICTSPAAAWCADRWLCILMGREISIQAEDGVHMYRNGGEGL